MPTPEGITEVEVLPDIAVPVAEVILIVVPEAVLLTITEDPPDPEPLTTEPAVTAPEAEITLPVLPEAEAIRLPDPGLVAAEDILLPDPDPAQEAEVTPGLLREAAVVVLEEEADRDPEGNILYQG